MTRTRIETIFVGNSLRNFTYLIEAEKDQYYCVDPFDAKGVEERLKELGGNLKGIINTHQHPDHICGNNDLIESYNAPVYAHYQADYERDFNPVKHNEILKLNDDNKIKFLDTPGHTMSHISLLLFHENQAWGILTGDTMFNAGVGHCKLGGHPETLYQTMSEIYGALDDKLEIFPGHEYFSNNLKFSLHCEPHNEKTKELLGKVEKIDWRNQTHRTTMEQEREINPFLRLDSKDLRTHLDMETSDNKEIFLKLRTMRNSW